MAAELATTAKEAAESKDSFLRDRSLMEASYLEKVDELTREKDAMRERILQQEEKLKQNLEEERNFEMKLSTLLLQLHSKEQEIVNQNKLLQEKEIKVVDLNAQMSDIAKETNELRRIVATQERKTHDAIKKNSELTKRCNDLQSSLKFTEDHKADISKKLINVSGELASSNEHVIQLKEDVHSLTLQVKRHQNGSAKEQERLQRAILQLSEDLRKEKEKQLTKSRDFEEFIEEIGNENTELKKTVDTLKSKIKNLSQRVMLMSADENSLQRKLEEELSSKSQLEGKVKLLQDKIENEKLTTSELSETLKAADQIKSNYEKEKSLQCRMMKESENMLRKKEAEIKSMKAFIKQLRMNLQNNEVKVSEHQKESWDLKEKLKYLNQQLDVLPKVRKELSLKIEEVNELNKYLAECNESRKLQSGVIIELQKQQCFLESREKKQLKELEALQKDAYMKDEKIFELKRRNQKSVKEHEDVDNVTKALAMQLESLQDENEKLKMELESVKEFLDNEQLKNREHASANHSEKHIDREKCGNRALEVQVNQLKNNLMITQGRLQKEVEWRIKTENELRTVRKAKTELQSQLSHLEEDISNKFIEYRKVLIKVEHLEKENSFLRLEVENQSKQMLSQLKDDS
ncbi:uncharacterized protein LOC135690612 [Rhopilema esculentum]|uniref:uncharacterized protein LOC135690612 n=1 Tax=Rhopilema esculentum TaxID=499914 RepID=UPI0031D5B7CB